MSGNISTLEKDVRKKFVGYDHLNIINKILETIQHMIHEIRETMDHTDDISALQANLSELEKICSSMGYIAGLIILNYFIQEHIDKKNIKKLVEGKLEELMQEKNVKISKEVAFEIIDELKNN